MPTCFVVMPFRETSERHTKEYWSEHYEYFIKPAIEGASDGERLLRYKAQLSNPAGGGIIGDVFRSLQEAEVVLADLTDFNPNVMYEIGIRHTLLDKTIMILEEGYAIPFYFQNYKIIRYSKQSAKDIANFSETIQRRLLELSQSTPFQWDNPVADYFRGIGQKVTLVSRQGPDLTTPALRESGFSTIYVPGTNAERNVRKEDVVQQAEQEIKLLASTGHSYLAMVGSRFKGALVNRLEASIPVQMILLNPWSESGVLLAIGEASEDSMSSVQTTALKKLAEGNLSGFDPVTLIEGSIYYRNKLLTSLQGYIELGKQFGKGLELRLCPHEISATLLLTERMGFFEPYIHANLLERLRASMLTFEVEFSDKSYLYRHSLAYFNILWKLSTPYKEFLRTEDSWKSQLRGKYEWKRTIAH